VRILDTVLDSMKDGSKLLKEYGFALNDAVAFCERNHGGSSLQPLEGEVWLTKEPCCVTYEDNPNEWRAKLACGHVVGKGYISNFHIQHRDSFGFACCHLISRTVMLVANSSSRASYDLALCASLLIRGASENFLSGALQILDLID